MDMTNVCLRLYIYIIYIPSDFSLRLTEHSMIDRESLPKVVVPSGHSLHDS